MPLHRTPMYLKLSYLAVGLVLGAGIPYVAGAALSSSSVSAATARSDALATPAAVAAHGGSFGVFAQYDAPPPEVHEIPTSAASPALTIGGVAAAGSGTSTLSPAPSHIAAEVDAGVTNMNKALATAPVAMAKMTESIARNGVIAALAYDDPQVKAQTEQLGQQLGASLRGFADAIAKDMQRSIKESGIQQQSAGR